ncbi:uncharacterized protein F4807DRAFT_423933 [Annulohypoxylon truncatum]|uniref:uncharacterized protein n=1 Tax=Annulohypoxylon truncatum TaxID=327061 RepID=UPI002008A19B|nr:uncharacterized protein F4807DRAFT_423933 [Annulohypoxylon truncatum]KAI1210138.1 hypothetical protein F4807DRAFT_423933 [Annulohypoxylon truncatum]
MIPRKNNPNTLSLEEFMEGASKKLEKGEEVIGVGLSVELMQKWYDTLSYLY